MQRSLSWIRSCGLEPILTEFLATNTTLSNPYHGLAHSLRVSQVAGRAAANHMLPDLGPWARVTDSNLVRTATVAGLCHDWCHPGKGGTDDKANVEKAAQFVMTLEDGLYGFTGTMAADAIRDTAFPYTGPPETGLGALLRDADIWHMADMSEEDFLEAEIGLAVEMGVGIGQWLRGNVKFLEEAQTWTKWGRAKALGSRERLVTWCKRWGTVLGVG